MEKTLNETVKAGSSASSEVVRIDFGNLKKDLSGFVRGTVEEALNGLLEAEAEQACNARQERSARRNGHYERNLERSDRRTLAGKGGLPFHVQ